MKARQNRLTNSSSTEDQCHNPRKVSFSKSSTELLIAMISGDMFVKGSFVICVKLHLDRISSNRVELIIGIVVNFPSSSSAYHR